jgi:ParB-like chromosome segregation protein Spo0J
VKKQLSVRETEALVRREIARASAPPAIGGQPSATSRRDAAISDVETRLRQALSTRVTVVPQRKGARITIECYSAEEFDNVVNTLLGDRA